MFTEEMLIDIVNGLRDIFGSNVIEIILYGSVERQEISISIWTMGISFYERCFLRPFWVREAPTGKYHGKYQRSQRTLHISKNFYHKRKRNRTVFHCTASDVM